MSTIADVARVAGVSISTVSYALSGKRPVAPDTALRVQAAIDQLNYRPHAGARALASNRTHVLGLVAPLRPEVGLPVIMQFVSALALGARQRDHDLLLLTQAEGTAGLERVTSSAMVDALIVMDVGSHDERIPLITQLRQPTVLIGLPEEPEGLSCVDLDFSQVAHLAVEHLEQLGHRSVVLIGSPARIYRRGINYALRVREAFVAETDKRGMHGVVVPCDHTPAGVAHCLEHISQTAPDATAIIIHNEEAMPAVLEALRAQGRRIPEDLSVIAVCPRDRLESQSIALTSIDIPITEISELAIAMVLQRLDSTADPHVQLAPTTLTARASTAPARTAGPGA
jgi:DNA-binding LacI/PurR family transcriptional regulator